MKKINIIFMLAIFLLMLGCGSKPYENKVTQNMQKEPITLNPTYSTDGDSATIEQMIFEGLYTTEPSSNKIVPAVSRIVNISEDGMTYIFNIRPGAMWSDGKSVVADDFEFAWKHALKDKNNPNISQLYFIKNAQKFIKGEVSENEIGVKALNDSKLELKLERPTPYLLSLLSNNPLYPLRRDVFEKDPEACTAKRTSCPSNGPFKFVSWEKGKVLKVAKNEKYWNQGFVNLDEIDFTFYKKPKSSNNFRVDELDIMLGTPDSKREEYIAVGIAKKYLFLGVSYYTINTKGIGRSREVAKFLGDARVRRAIGLAIDRQTISKEVLDISQAPATTFVPPNVLDTEGVEFKNKDYYSLNYSLNIIKAQQLLQDAGYSDTDRIPVLTLTVKTSPNTLIIAQAVQQMLQEIGVTLKIRNLDEEAYEAAIKKTDYDIVSEIWIGEFDDPMAFLSIFEENSVYNHSKYTNPEYKKLLDMANLSFGKYRTELLHRAEAELISDMPLIPLFYSQTLITANPKVKNWHYTKLGVFDYTEAYVEK